MKRLLFSAALGLLVLASTGHRASAWGLLHWCCCHDCCATICCKQYNAFTPCCFGTICCNGCCPIAYGNCGPNAPGPMGCGPGPGACFGPDCSGGDGALLGQLPAPPPTPYSGGTPLPSAGSGSPGPDFKPPMPNPAPPSTTPRSEAWPVDPTYQAGYYPQPYGGYGYGALNPQAAWPSAAGFGR